MGNKDFVDHITEQWAAIRSDVDPAPLEIIPRVSRASELINRRLDQPIRRAGLRVKGDYQTLAALRRNRPRSLSATELAKEVMVSTSGLTGRLDRLERLGLIRRLPDPADRRAVQVELTEEGVEVVDSLYATSIAIQADMIGVLTIAERTELAAIMRKLLISLGDHAP